MQGYVRPIGAEWVFGTADAAVTVAAGVTSKSYYHKTLFGAAGHTLYLKLDATSVGSAVSVTGYAHAAGDATVVTNYGAITPDIVLNPTTLTTDWQPFDFTPAATDYVGFVLTNREGANAVKVYGLYVHGG